MQEEWEDCGRGAGDTGQAPQEALPHRLQDSQEARLPPPGDGLTPTSLLAGGIPSWPLAHTATGNQTKSQNEETGKVIIMHPQNLSASLRKKNPKPKTTPFVETKHTSNYTFSSLFLIIIIILMVKTWQNWAGSGQLARNLPRKHMKLDEKWNVQRKTKIPKVYSRKIATKHTKKHTYDSNKKQTNKNETQNHTPSTRNMPGDINIHWHWLVKFWSGKKKLNSWDIEQQLVAIACI